MNPDIKLFNNNFDEPYNIIADKLYDLINRNFKEAESKIWHRHPVWFINENPIVGYSKQKPGIRLMFWSGQDFNEEKLNIHGKKFKDASIFFNSPKEIVDEDIIRWIEKSKNIQWDYKNLIKRKGKLERL